MLLNLQNLDKYWVLVVFCQWMYNSTYGDTDSDTNGHTVYIHDAPIFVQHSLGVVTCGRDYNMSTASYSNVTIGGFSSTSGNSRFYTYVTGRLSFIMLNYNQPKSCFQWGRVTIAANIDYVQPVKNIWASFLFCTAIGFGRHEGTFYTTQTEPSYIDITCQKVNWARTAQWLLIGYQ